MSDDGWTQVAKSKKSRLPKAVNGHNPPSRDMTIDRVRGKFRDGTKLWQQSDSRKSLSILLERIRPDEGWNLQRAVCIGSGSLSRDNVECQRRSVLQMVVFVEIAKLCGIEKLYAQEPTYTSLDKSFLSTLGVEVLDLSTEKDEFAFGPAEDLLGPDTLLFEPFLDMYVRMVHAMVQKDVGLFIGSSIYGLLERGKRVDAVARTRHLFTEADDLAKTFAEGRAFYQFPTFDPHPNTFTGMQIYWK